MQPQTTLVLLPGLDGTGRMFADFIDALGPGVKTIVASYPVDAALGYEDLEPMVRSLLPDEPHYLLAESFSGPLAIRIAASSPPGLQGLILCCTFARNPMPRSGRFRFLLGMFPVTATPMWLVNFFVLNRSASPALRCALQETLDRVSPDAFLARVRALLTVDVTPQLAAIKLPILSLVAGNDRLLSRRPSEVIAAFAPHAQTIEFPVPHCLLQMAPAATAAAALRFMGVQPTLA